MDPSESKIIAASGWTEKKCPPYQPKALFFRTLSWLWIFPSLTSLFIIAANFPKKASATEFLGAVRVEQWVCLGLLLLHPLWLLLARRYRMKEPFCEVVLEPKPGEDPKNLY